MTFEWNERSFKFGLHKSPVFATFVIEMLVPFPLANEPEKRKTLCSRNNLQKMIFQSCDSVKLYSPSKNVTLTFWNTVYIFLKTGTTAITKDYIAPCSSQWSLVIALKSQTEQNNTKQNKHFLNCGSCHLVSSNFHEHSPVFFSPAAEAVSFAVAP